MCYVVRKPIGGSATGTAASVTSCAVSIDELNTRAPPAIDIDYYVLRKLFPALMRVLRLVPLQLRWSGTTVDGERCAGYFIAHLPLKFLSCLAANWHPWCNECWLSERAYTEVLVRLSTAAKRRQRLLRLCRECVQPCKSVDIEQVAGDCANYDCPVKKGLMAAAATASKEALAQHSLANKVKYQLGL